MAAGPVKIGVAAMISPKETVKYYKQMIDYVSTKLGQPVEMVQKENYDETDKMLESGELPIAFVCSGPYVKDHDKFGAELLVAPQSYGQPFYHAYIIVHKDSPITELSALKGKKFAFTDPKSNTGKIVPTYMIGKEFKTTPEKFFGKVLYTKSHDKSVEAVAKKLVDGASIDSLIYDYAVKKNPQFTSQTKIIRKSPKYGIPPVVVRKDLSPALKAKIKDIFLNMHKDPEGKAILDGIMVDKFIVPKDSDYNSVREMDAWLKKNVK
jgi:phosphonate transport system substrate-binding protein